MEQETHPPGDSGVVTVTFNPKDRPGVFSKKIIVYTNATPPNIVLRLEGEVITKSVDIPTTYPIVVGNLRFTTDTIRLKQAETKHQIINLINTGKKNISICRFSNLTTWKWIAPLSRWARK